jgi:hypothetical protein
MALQVLRHVDKIPSLPTGKTMESLFVKVDDHIRAVFVRVKRAQADHPVAPGLPQNVALTHQVLGERQTLADLVQHRPDCRRHLSS